MDFIVIDSRPSCCGRMCRFRVPMMRRSYPLAKSAMMTLNADVNSAGKLVLIYIYIYLSWSAHSSRSVIRTEACLMTGISYKQNRSVVGE